MLAECLGARKTPTKTRVDRASRDRDRYPSAAAGCDRHCCANGDPRARRGSQKVGKATLYCPTIHTGMCGLEVPAQTAIPAWVSLRNVGELRAVSMGGTSRFVTRTNALRGISERRHYRRNTSLA